MTAPLIAVLVSGAAMVALIVLFRYERAHGARFAKTIRTAFDQAIEDMAHRAGRRYREVTGQTVRQSIHYVFHQILTGILRAIRRVEDRVHAVAQFNRNRANRRIRAAPTPHFSEIADHKREVALSDTEKQQKRDQALNAS